MKIIIKKITDSTPAFEAYIEKKLFTLVKLIEPFEKEGETEIALDIVRTSRHHEKGEDIFMASADLRLPKKVIRAEEYGDNMRLAVDRMRDALKLEIEKYKAHFFEIDRKKLDKNKEEK